ncbi:outer membrane beta-barrel protein [Endozoicomonas sp. GU-1]|uniref:outer membrane protein n=1 Tax=Endozoicomonas sp. GU-1 TaxID=3009078 RepID=UPI0022B485E9|nr:outer membrane beta-barrel protein [Endozoicomonas sp. GU-1]WBA82819.1 outer membrane beta-barrel protein [Endozoicomonas sp. GU-1]
MISGKNSYFAYFARAGIKVFAIGILPFLFLGTSFASEHPWDNGVWFAQLGGGTALSRSLEDDRTLKHAGFDLQDRFKNWQSDQHGFFGLLSGGYEIPWQDYQVRLAVSFNQMGELEHKGVRGPTGDLENTDLNYRYKTRSRQLMAEAGIQLPVTDHKMTFIQLGLGLGIGWNKFQGFSITPAEGSMSSLNISDHKESQLAWSLGVSIAVPVHESLGLEAGYRYLHGGKIKSANSSQYSSPLVDDTLAFHLYEARLTWRF